MGSGRSPRQAIQDAHDPASRQAGVDLEGEGFPGKDVDDAQEPDRPARGQRVLQEIQRPLFVGAPGAGGRPRQTRVADLACAAAHGQAFLAVEPLDPLVVDA